MLKRFEQELFFGDSSRVSLDTLLTGCARDMSGEADKAQLALFARLASHFYLVCEWIVQLIISQPGHTSRRAMLTCVLRFAHASWNIGNFNAVMEILLGLRYVCIEKTFKGLSCTNISFFAMTMFELRILRARRKKNAGRLDSEEDVLTRLPVHTISNARA